MLSPVRVFAAAGDRDFNTAEITVTDGGITSAGRLTPTYLVDSNYNILMHLVPFIPDPGSLLFDPSNVTGDVFVVYSGTISISHTYTFNTTSTTEPTVYHDGYIVGFISDNVSIATNQGVSGGLESEGSFVSRVTVDSIDTSCNFNGNTNPRIGTVNNFSTTIWDMVDLESNFVAMGTIRHNYNIDLSVSVKLPSDFYTANSDWSTLMNSYIIPTCTSSYSSAVIRGSNYNFREILEGLDEKLYLLWGTENLIYDALTTADTNNTNKLNQVITAIQQLDLSNSADIQRIIDLMTNNNSGVAEDSDTVKSNLATANAAADDAIEDAVHDYDAELQEIKDFDHDAFFSNQVSAVGFWTYIGEYILDSDNIGFFATGLIICTLVTVFVFLLRL